MTDSDRMCVAAALYYERVVCVTTVVYVDKLLAVNVLLGVILLLSASRLCGIHIKRGGLFLGAALSSLSSLLIFLPTMPIILSVLIKTVSVALIVYCSFFPKSLKSFFKAFGAFFAVNFVFAGIVLAIQFLLSPDGIMYINGAVYFDISALMLVCLFGLCYGALSLGEYLISKRAKPSDKLTLEISFRGKTVLTEALFDSGSTLKESFSGRPVIAAELVSIAGLLEPQELPFFKDGYLKGEAPESIRTRVRLIPYRVVGSDGLMPAFKADQVKCIRGTHETVSKDIYIGVVTVEFSAGEYRAIASAALME